MDFIEFSPKISRLMPLMIA